MKAIATLLALCLSAMPLGAAAECVCKCVNGEVVPICTSSIDIEPICAPRICPITPPRIKPIDPPVIPPIGTRGCTNKQVYNEYTHQYEWRLVCK